MNACRRCSRRPVVRFLLALLAATAVAGPSRASDPHLLLSPAEIPRLRHRAGVSRVPDAPAAWGRFAVRADDYHALRSRVAGRAPGPPLPGETLAAAFLHLVEPEDPADRDRIGLVADALRRPVLVTSDTLELILALDWCWDALPPELRARFVHAAREQAQPLEPGDSPLEPRHFRRPLAGLALALAIDETRDASPSWLAQRRRLLEAGRAYFETTLPRFVAWRGLAPTGPSVAAREECDTVLAVELARMLLGEQVWDGYRGSVGRWMEHYVLARLAHPHLVHHFIRDDAGSAPLTPAPRWKDLLPLTAHLIAARTDDPAAVTVARQVETELRSETVGLLPALWRWVPIALSIEQRACCDEGRLPSTRDFGGAVVFRSGLGYDATAVWIESGQPLLRRRQHFDAGHFLIRRGGHLTVGGGDDIAFEAIPSKEGFQRLGRSSEAFDFEQYYTATIAHNAVVFWDAARVERWYGALYRPAGGQRCVECTCTDFATPAADQGRQTGTRLAYGPAGDAAYLALDLGPAYDQRTVSAYTREFVFLWGRGLVVIDRIRPALPRVRPTWILNIPSRPSVDGEPLADAARVAGSTNEAGVWRYPDAGWIHWSEGDGGLWMANLLPEPRRLRIAGGPGARHVVRRGPHAGQIYRGGSGESYERLVVPADRHGALNAWYRLGEPTLLGPQVGVRPHWGRIEIEPDGAGSPLIFITALIAVDAADHTRPETGLDSDDTGHVLRLRAGEDSAVLRLPAGMGRGGALQIGEGRAVSLPVEVQADPPLPTRPQATEPVR